MSSFLFPPLTDLFALLGVNLVLCAALLRLLLLVRGAQNAFWKKGAVLLVFVLLWLPAGSAGIPLVAYVRGVSSDLSVTLVALAALGLWQRLRGVLLFDRREKRAVQGLIAIVAVFLYPLALGLGDHDLYRAGWGSWVLLAVLLLVSAVAWWRGLRLLPLLSALALLAWSAGLMESSNLFDYLMDPWIAVGSLWASSVAAVGCARSRLAAAAGRRAA